ncbi:MAG TPA: GNAT family N-acetyltransferase [Acidimicrobiia bacterium]|nr:GNAT family N-acetyltransferase [Acidimicrobiia bacterium]
MHPLRVLLDTAAGGEYPPADGAFDVLPPPDGLADVMIGFTGHFVLAAAIEPGEVEAQVPAGDFSVPMSAAFLTWVANRLGSRPGTFDALLCATGNGAGLPPWLREIDALDHPRVARAARYRSDMRTYATEDGTGVLIVGRGICGRWEIGYEVAPDARDKGLGRRIVEAARGLVAAGEPVWAQVAPGNAASLRSAIAGGFTPIAAEVLFPRSR